MRVALAVSCLLLFSLVGPYQDDRGPVVQFKVETSVDEGVKRFNERVNQLQAGKGQLPLTSNEVIAAIRGWIPEEHPVTPEVLKRFQEIAETGKLPPGSSLRFMQSWSGYNGFNFEVWWVDIQLSPVDRSKKDPVIGFGYSFRIRDQKIRSWPMTEDEKRRMEEDRKRFEEEQKKKKAADGQP